MADIPETLSFFVTEENEAKRLIRLGKRWLDARVTRQEGQSEISVPLLRAVSYTHLTLPTKA